MFRSFLRLVKSTTTPVAAEAPTVSDTKKAATSLAQPAPATKPKRPRSRGSHRERLLSMRLEHVKLCGARRCEMFAKAEIISVGDLASCDPAQVARRMEAPSQAVATIKRYRRCIRLAASIPGLMPRDADLLIRVHRATVDSIARDSASLLYRDLQRFAESSEGRRFVGKRRLPSLRKVKSWVVSCKNQAAARSAAQSRAEAARSEAPAENPAVFVV